MVHPVSIDGSEMRGLARSIGEVDGLLLLLALLYFFATRAPIQFPGAYFMALGAFGCFILIFRYTGLLEERPRLKLALEATAMTVFITAILGFAGGDRGPLLNLYLLPVITSALTLGRGATAGQIMLLVAGRIFLSISAGTVPVVSLGYVLSLSGELAPILLVAFLTTTLAKDIHTARRRILALSDQDDLTGVYNMRAFTRLLKNEYRKAERRKAPFAILMVDVDGLKAINDRYGHEAGNRAIIAVAHSLRRSTRPMDLVARYGGDEFILFLSGAGREIAEVVANRIRHNVFSTTLDFAHNMRRLSVSIGTAVYPDDGTEIRALMSVADKTMYQEKELRQEPGAV